MQEYLPILYQDDYLVVVDKPPGLLVHKSPVDRFETRFAMKILRNQLQRWVYPVHRLDKPTSGALVFALDETTAKRLADQFASRSVKKTYLALVRGWPALGGIIDHPIREIEMFKNDQGKFERKTPRVSRTLYRRLATTELQRQVDVYAKTRYALLACYPKTGRQHQIRRHLKHIAHPIIGDVRYGKGVHNRYFENAYQTTELMLMAKAIDFTHPVANSPVHVQAPLPPHFLKVMGEFSWSIT